MPWDPNRKPGYESRHEIQTDDLLNPEAAIPTHEQPALTLNIRWLLLRCQILTLFIVFCFQQRNYFVVVAHNLRLRFRVEYSGLLRSW
jgi:hypothetical protein